MTSVLIDSGPGTGKTYTISALTAYLRATNKAAFLKTVRLSDEQLHILDWIKEHIPVDDATTMIGMSYNKDAALQLNSRTHRTVECRSHHGWGYKILQKKYGYLKINSQRTNVIIESVTGIPLAKNKEKYQWLVASRFLEKLKDELLDPTPENLQRLADKYEDLAAFKVDSDTSSKIQKLIGPSKTPMRSVGIEYIDQIWLALFLLKKPLYDIAIVDEAQDQSPARHQLAELIAKHKIYVGDGNQSINAFSGADPYSIEKIRYSVDKVLDLKTSFRCPPNVIDKLNRLKPESRLKGLPKPNGEEKRIKLNAVCETIETKHEAGETYKTHLMICRYNAPLIKLARRLLQNNIPCRILGDRLIDSLIRIIDTRKAVNVEDLEEKLNKYQDQLTRNSKPYIQEQVKDKIDCIRLVLESSSTIDEAIQTLRSLLKSTADDHIRLATIHKSKGLEAHNVWIAFPPIESPRAGTKEQIDQETNVRYVAESRTSCNTYWIVEDEQD